MSAGELSADVEANAEILIMETAPAPPRTLRKSRRFIRFMWTPSSLGLCLGNNSGSSAHRLKSPFIEEDVKPNPWHSKNFLFVWIFLRAGRSGLRLLLVGGKFS